MKPTKSKTVHVIYHTNSSKLINNTDTNINLEGNRKPVENIRTTMKSNKDLLLNSTLACKHCLENEDRRNKNNVKTQQNSICWLQIALPPNSEQVSSCQSLHK